MRSFDEVFKEVTQQASPGSGSLTYHNMRSGHNDAFQNEYWKAFMQQIATDLVLVQTSLLLTSNIKNEEITKRMILSAVTHLDAMFQLGLTVGLKMAQPELDNHEFSQE